MMIGTMQLDLIGKIMPEQLTIEQKIDRAVAFLSDRIDNAMILYRATGNKEQALRQSHSTDESLKALLKQEFE